MADKDKSKDKLYTLISLDSFKAFLGVDDREDKLCRFCLTTSTFTIEQYCMRRFLRKKHVETVEYYGDKFLPLREYPVSNVLSAYSMTDRSKTGELIEPDLYSLFPNSGIVLDIPYCLMLSPAIQRYRGIKAIKVVYWAGYTAGNIPQDLAAACMELALWNFGRYKGRRVGMSGNVRGSGKNGEHFEMSIPENVRQLLEPYKRKVI